MGRKQIWAKNENVQKAKYRKQNWAELTNLQFRL